LRFSATASSPADALIRTHPQRAFYRITQRGSVRNRYLRSKDTTRHTLTKTAFTVSLMVAAVPALCAGPKVTPLFDPDQAFGNDIVVHNDQVALKLRYDVCVIVNPILADRTGQRRTS